MNTRSRTSRAERRAAPKKPARTPSGVVRRTRRTGVVASTRRTVVQALPTSSAALAFPSIVRAAGRAGARRLRDRPHRPWTTGAQVSQEPNYLLWAEQQNAAGG